MLPAWSRRSRFLGKTTFRNWRSPLRRSGRFTLTARTAFRTPISLRAGRPSSLVFARHLSGPTFAADRRVIFATSALRSLRTIRTIRTIRTGWMGRSLRTLRTGWRRGKWTRAGAWRAFTRAFTVKLPGRPFATGRRRSIRATWAMRAICAAWLIVALMAVRTLGFHGRDSHVTGRCIGLGGAARAFVARRRVCRSCALWSIGVLIWCLRRSAVRRVMPLFLLTVRSRRAHDSGARSQVRLRRACDGLSRDEDRVAQLRSLAPLFKLCDFHALPQHTLDISQRAQVAARQQ